MTITVDELLAAATFRRDDLQAFLDPGYPTWARFDPELGYLLGDIAMRDGMDEACSLYAYEDGGQRKMIHFADQPCRINTYGNSFTQCHQVSNGETWQEYLAAHFGEPIRNFGVGGHGVYQAYRRMLRHEADDGLSAPCVVLNIYDDDHVRNIDACRWLRMYTGGSTRSRQSDMFHGNPWAHVRLDLQTGRFHEQPSMCPTEDGLRALCDPQRFRDTFEDDSVLRLWVLSQGGEVDDVADLERLGKAVGVEASLRGPDKANAAARVHMAYALKSTEWVLDRMRAWLATRDKKLLVLLSYSTRSVIAALRGEQRFDQSLIDYLQRHDVPYVDSLAKHVADYEAFSVDPEAYVQRYYIGHYNPMGNLFFAMAVKDELVDWLDPEPPLYRAEGDAMAEMVAKLA